MATVNISLPTTMYKDAKRVLSKKGYASLSELIRDSLRKTLYPEITENGFTREFEDQVLEAEKEPMENDIVLETEEDIDKSFDEVIKRIAKKKHGKNS